MPWYTGSAGNDRMKGSLIYAALAMLIGGALSHPKVHEARLQIPAFSGAVTHVADGDTLDVVSNGQVEKIRLQRVDAPELHQKYGPEAKTFTVNWCVEHPNVTITPSAIDRYGRTVAEVSSPDGSTLEDALVEHGFAWWYSQYDPSDPSLEAEQTAARTAKLGLWADSNPTPPWEFRKLEAGGTITLKHNGRVTHTINLDPSLGTPSN